MTCNWTTIGRHHSIPNRQEGTGKGLPQGKSVPGLLPKEGTIKEVSINGKVKAYIITPNPPAFPRLAGVEEPLDP